jgi:hypothetical protein
MIVLDERKIEARSGEAIGIPAFKEEASAIAKYLGLDDERPWEVRLNELHPIAARPESSPSR